jgi:hypothetical protein
VRPQRIHLIPNDWSHLETELNHLTKWIASQSVTTISSPTFIGLTLTGLTATRLVATGTGGVLASVSNLASWIAGTANQVSIANDGDGTVTLSLPQDIHTAATPTFGGLTLGTFAGVIKGTAGVLSGSATMDDVANGSSTTMRTNLNADLLDGQHSAAFQAAGSYQTQDADLDAIAALGFTTTAFLKKTALNTWALDTSVYLTAEVDTLGTVVARGANAGATINVGAGNTLVLASGSITDTTGNISLGDENLITTGTLGVGIITATSLNLTANSNQIVLNSDDPSGYKLTLTGTATSVARLITFPDATGTVVLGTGASTSLAFWTGANNLSSSSILTFVLSTGSLTLTQGQILSVGANGSAGGGNAGSNGSGNKFTGGIGGSSSGSTPGAGGAFEGYGGVGGQSSGISAGGTGGLVKLQSGTGGSNVAAGGGAGGNFYLISGTGAAGNSFASGGGGNFLLTAGAGGNNNYGNAGNGGYAEFIGGNGGNSIYSYGNGGAGGNFYLYGGIGGTGAVAGSNGNIILCRSYAGTNYGFVGIRNASPTVALDVTGAGLFSETLGVTGLTTLTGGISLPAGANVALATTTGTKIGTATNQLLGFYNAAPVDQPATVGDAATQDLTGTDTIDKTKLEADLTSCKNSINTVIDRLQELGLIA